MEAAFGEVWKIHLTIVISLINLTLLSLFCGDTIHSIWVIIDAFIFVGEHKHLLIRYKKAMIYLFVCFEAKIQ